MISNKHGVILHWIDSKNRCLILYSNDSKVFELPVPFTLFGMVGRNGKMGFSFSVQDIGYISFCYGADKSLAKKWAKDIPR